MNTRRIIAIIAGVLLTLTSAYFGYFQASAMIGTQAGSILNVAILIVAPYAGGFLAGLIAKDTRRQVGLICGISAGTIMIIAAFLLLDVSIQMTLILLLLLILWTFLARLGARMAGKD